MTKEFEDRLLAKLFGIPKCCVDYYCNPTVNIRNAPALTGGVRLCPSCAKVPVIETVKKINKNRICPQPFPDHPTESDFQDLLSNNKFSTEEIEWLKSNKKRFIDLGPESDFEKILRDYVSELGNLQENFQKLFEEEEDLDGAFLSMYKMKSRELELETIEAMYSSLRKVIVSQIKKGIISI